MNDTSTRLTTLKLGAFGGLLAVFIALVGMIEAFAARGIITGVIDMGRTLILVSFFFTGYLVFRQSHRTPAPSISIPLQGALGGLISAAFLVALALLQSVLPSMRNIFVNATPELSNALTFGQSLTIGLPLLLVLGAVMGALPGIVQFLPSPIRRGLLNGLAWVILVGLLQELITVTFRSIPGLRELSNFIFAQSGLSILGAVILFAIVFGVEWFRVARGDAVRERYAQLDPARRRVLKLVGLALLVLLLLTAPAFLGVFVGSVLVQVGLYTLMGFGLNIVVGFAGLLDLGYVAFFAIGAYTTAMLTSTSKEVAFAGGFPFWVGLPVAIVVCLFAGFLLGVPVLKVRGDYLAIVTLGFGEIIRLLALSDFLKPYLAGSRGFELIPKPFVGPFELKDPQQLFYLILAGCLVVGYISVRLKNSRLGRAWMAVREDEDVAQSMGINLVATKLLAFGMGAAFAGIGGAINASYLAIIYPHSMNVLVSINVLALIIIGGMGSIPGVIVGALALVGLPELLRELGDFRLLIYGAVLVIMMLMRPEGLMPEARRAMELEEFREKDAPAIEATVS